MSDFDDYLDGGRLGCFPLWMRSACISAFIDLARNSVVSALRNFGLDMGCQLRNYPLHDMPDANRTSQKSRPQAD